jgi:V8-like Glu-specific endopeptidase
MKYSKPIVLAGLLTCMNLSYAVPVAGVVSEQEALGTSAAKMVSDNRAVQSYWTKTKMAAAKPMPTPLVSVSSTSLNFRPIAQESLEIADPGFTPGCKPNATNCDTRPRKMALQSGLPNTSESFGDLIQPMHGSKPVNPKDGPYGPFQRWREAEAITAYPKSTVGKLFFSLGGQNWVCSASVIGRSTLITAGHCNSDGAGNFATNRLFCPSYKNGANPSRGCWSVVTSVVSNQWHNSGDPDYDYSCLVTAASGTVVANKIGNVTGTLGRAWNFNPSQAVRTFGYPQAAPFTGGTLQTTASTEWYTHDFTLGGQISKIIGSDLTGGSSGGPWILGWTGGLAETADTDASQATDPGTNWVNGINSHKRCVTDCGTPTTTSGVFWQEMTSPPFRNTTGDINESEDVIGVCLANANNNP